jgi:uncharacterized repeat protein (TIGR03803 family)
MEQPNTAAPTHPAIRPRWVVVWSSKRPPGGTLTTLYSFCSKTNCTDGAYPTASLLLLINGNFLGTTLAGGANGFGSVFEITPAGKLTTLYSFCSVSGCIDGISPETALIQGTDGNFYGTTVHGGRYGCGGCHGAGTVFKMTAGGRLTTAITFARKPTAMTAPIHSGH